MSLMVLLNHISKQPRCSYLVTYPGQEGVIKLQEGTWCLG
jgi:hypothetical protein